MVTDTVCVDGKRHSWIPIAAEQENYGAVRRVEWCKKCGSTTESVKEFRDKGYKRCKEEDRYYIEIPELAKKEES
jgi:hypothetical protein